MGERQVYNDIVHGTEQKTECSQWTTGTETNSSLMSPLWSDSVSSIQKTLQILQVVGQSIEEEEYA